MAKTYRIGLIGNPNCGKTTVFNALTGAKQHIGNWPGVTVERKEGALRLPNGSEVVVVDLPGIYSLAAGSEDERVSVEYALSGEADLFVNVIDGTNLERNLYLTLLLSELKVPMIHVVTMMDIVKERKIKIDLKHLEQHLGCPVIGISASDSKDIKALVSTIEQAVENPVLSKIKIEYTNEVETELEAITPVCPPVATAFRTNARWVALRLLEGDPLVCEKAASLGVVQEDTLSAARARIVNILKEFPDESIADSRYGIIQGLCHEVVTKTETREYFTQRADKFILNKWLGIPFFLFVMYIVFWVTQVVGGAFIDFFDILGGTVFVDGPAFLLEKMGVPAFVVALIANGLGAGLQTMSTFLPPIFFMFFCLAILEDSGYMARAAFVMDRFMRWLGLPGKSFVPLLVGFGCSVPAIMATRTLESKRDRFLAIFMTPFMSCGAKLPVYVVFGATFFAANPGRLVFMIYASGMILGVLTGLMLKRTLFYGEPSHFIMELPPYHLPRLKHILIHSWERLRIFIFRAGKVIVPMVLILGVMNTVGKDGSIGNENSENSILSSVGTALTPVFEPMGVEKDNWPATVAIFTGLFAKEAVIGTMTSLYGQNSSLEAAKETGSIGGEKQTAGSKEEGYHFWGGIGKAFASIPKGLSGVVAALADPLGLGDVTSDEKAVANTFNTETSVFTNMRGKFSKGSHQAFAYLLFILLYVPCIAAMGAAFRELGRFYGIVLMEYLTILGWSVATLYYQITLGHQALWIAVPCALLVSMFGGFRIMGRRRKIQFI